MALAENYAMVLAGLILGGMGCGLVMNGLSIIVANQNGEDQTKGFSVINGAILSGIICGTVIGATLAENLGESIGTMVFGGMLSIGLVTGMWIFTGISAVTLGIYTLMGKQKK